MPLSLVPEARLNIDGTKSERRGSHQMSVSMGNKPEEKGGHVSNMDN
jgi:hypothetical protein